MSYNYGNGFLHIACDLCGLVLGDYFSHDDQFVPIKFTDEETARRRARGRGWHVPTCGEVSRELSERCRCAEHYETEVIHCCYCRTVGLRKVPVQCFHEDGTPALDRDHNQVWRWAWLPASDQPPADVRAGVVGGQPTGQSGELFGGGAG